MTPKPTSYTQQMKVIWHECQHLGEGLNLYIHDRISHALPFQAFVISYNDILLTL